jgi:hypothetical protein
MALEQMGQRESQRAWSRSCRRRHEDDRIWFNGAAGGADRLD